MTWIVSRWVLVELKIWCKIGHFFTPNESNEINGVKNRLYLHHFVSIGVCGAKSPEAGGRSKGMAIRGHVSGGDPRSGEDERQRTFRRPPATGRRHYFFIRRKTSDLSMTTHTVSTTLPRVCEPIFRSGFAKSLSSTVTSSTK